MCRFLSVLLLAAVCSAVAANGATLQNGTDTFMAGAGDFPALDAPGDVFAIGGSVALHGQAAGDVNAMGFSVEIDIPARQDLYAVGGSVAVRAPVGSDLSAAGFSVRTSQEATVTGNARLAGGSVVVDGPVQGALTASGAEVTLNSQVGGDVRVQAGAIKFGPEAHIGGQLIYAAPKQIPIPSSVVSADRVTYRPSETASEIARWHDDWRHHPRLPGFVTLFSGFLLVLGFLVVLGAVCLLIAPVLTERLRRSGAQRPGFSLVAGFLGMASLFGAVPVAAMTVVGFPLVPIAILLIVLAWTLGYLLAAYVIGFRALVALGHAEPAMAGRILALALTLAALSVLNFIPVLGWIINVALTLFGVGTLTRPIFARLGAPLAEAETGEQTV